MLYRKFFAFICIVALICSCVGCKSDTGQSNPTETTPAATNDITSTTSPSVPAIDPSEPIQDETDPTETIPVVTSPIETIPAETEPVETNPTETVPVETEPIEEPTQPEDPVETEPVETEPEEEDPSEAETTPDEPEETVSSTYTDVNETVYATSTVNVRSGAGSSYNKLGSLSKGDSVTRTGIGSNGWSRVIYNGQEAYIHSSYLSTSKPSSSGTSTGSNSSSINGLDVAKLAVEYLGLKYVYGGNSLTKGTDCSGFTSLIYKEFGISLPRTAAAQSKVGTPISLSEAKPGDLYAVEYSDKTNYTGHAGIYIGNGYMISAWPGGGVYITRCSESDTFIRLFKNTCSVSGEDAIKELEKHCIACGMYGSYQSASYYVDTETVTFYGESPLLTGLYDGIMLTVDVMNPEEGYEPLVKAWKKAYLEKEDDFTVIGPEYVVTRYDKDGNPYEETTRSSWGYLNGVWYSSAELDTMKNAGEITSTQRRKALVFYGTPWDIHSDITNGLGETVDFSAFP